MMNIKNTVTETQNPLGFKKESRLLVEFAIPCVISMLVTALYNIVDQIFIGQGVGMLGNAATNIAFPVSIICTATALLLGIGSASLSHSPRPVPPFHFCLASEVPPMFP